MCGRFSQFHTWADLRSYFDIFGPTRNLSARYNIAPIQNAHVVRQEMGSRRIDLLRWGLVPFWAKDGDMAARMINARAETVAEKPSFRSAFRQRRCLVPTHGFFEWRGQKGAKQPYWIFSSSGGLLAFAGLWDRWEKGKEGPLETFTIITTEANTKLAPVHHRMPVILDPTNFERWLAPDLTTNEAQAMLCPAPEGAVDFHAVSRNVNNARNDNPACIEPLPEGEDSIA